MGMRDLLFSSNSTVSAAVLGRLFVRIVYSLTLRILLLILNLSADCTCSEPANARNSDDPKLEANNTVCFAYDSYDSPSKKKLKRSEECAKKDTCIAARTRKSGCRRGVRRGD